MKHRAFLSNNDGKARSKLTKILHNYPLLCGSLVTLKRKCGKKGCKCEKGEKHVSLCLSILVEGKRKMVHVPRDWEERIKKWVGNYKEAQDLMHQVSQVCLKRFLEDKKRKQEVNQK